MRDERKKIKTLRETCFLDVQNFRMEPINQDQDTSAVPTQDQDSKMMDHHKDEPQNAYQVLGVEPDMADKPDELKRHFHRLARQVGINQSINQSNRLIIKRDKN